MDNYIMINGVKLELTPDQVAALTAEPVKDDPFERRRGAEYCYINWYGAVEIDMERLTINLNPTTNRCVKVSTDACYKYGNCFDCPQYKKMVDRLATYEDTGLEPEEITDLMAAHGTGIGQLAEYRAIGTAKHLQELVQADTDGRLVVLPCKVGDTVYAITESICKWRDVDKRSNCSGHSSEGCWEGTLEIEECEFTVDMIGKFGKSIFLTRKQAEAAMGGY